MIQAHGTRYATKAAAEARIAELNEENLRLGASDGRVTEIQAIITELQDAGYEATPQEAHQAAGAAALAAARAARTPTLDPALTGYVREAEQRIRAIEADRSRDDRQTRYLKYQDDAERVTRREYLTELGFLRAYVRAARGGYDILIAE